MNDFTIGLLPPPGNFSKGINASKFRKIVEAGKETTVLAEELGFTTKEIVELEKAGKLEEAVIAHLDVSLSENEVLQNAIRNNRHVKMDYNKGELKAYCLVFSLLKNQAEVFNIDQEDIGLAGIELERDLL